MCAMLSQLPDFSYLLTTSDASVVLNALTQITDVKISSSPTLLVLDNEPARLQVGDQVPISIRSSTSVTDPEAPMLGLLTPRVVRDSTDARTVTDELRKRLRASENLPPLIQ